MAEDTNRLLLPSRSGVSSLLHRSESSYSGHENVNGLSSETSMDVGLSSWPVCCNYPECEICEQCAKHSVYQKRVSLVLMTILLTVRVLCWKYFKVEWFCSV